MTQDWNFAPAGQAVLAPPGPKPTPRRFRKLLRREEENLHSALPSATPNEAAAAAAEGPQEQTGRDPRGRFTAGNKGGTGNPFARQIAGFRQLLANAVTPARFERIADALAAKAERGDLAATKLLFTYLLGKQAETPNPDRLDLDDFQLLRERLSTLEDDWHLIRKMVPVEGIIEAGHRVADLRAGWWREEVLGAGQEDSESGATGKAEEASDSYEPSPLLQEMLAALRPDPEQPAPSTSGSAEASAPSPNGVAEASAPSANGVAVASAPSTNGGTEVSAPSANGGTEVAGVGSAAPRAEVASPAPRRRPSQAEKEAALAAQEAVLRRLDRFGQLPEFLAKLVGHPQFHVPAAPGGKEARSPSRNGGDGGAPSANGGHGGTAPSGNGGNGPPAPSENGQRGTGHRR